MTYNNNIFVSYYFNVANVSKAADHHPRRR